MGETAKTKSSNEKKHQELLEIIRKKSFREGDFTLASGKKSSFYFDLKETTLFQKGAMLVGELACELMARENLKPYAVGGMTMGADPIATAVSFAAGLQGQELQAFIVRKEPKGHGTGQWLEGVKTFPAGASLLVVEDVVTTGGSSLKAIQAIQESGYKVIGVLTIVDREEGGREAFASAGIQLYSLCTLTELRARS